MDAPPGAGTRIRSKPFAILVITAGLAYLGIGLLGLSLAFGLSLTSGFGIFLLVFTLLFLLGAAGTFLIGRWGMVEGLVVTIVFLVLFSYVVPSAFADPASPGAWYILSAVPISVLVVILSILSLVHWKAGIAQTRYLASPHSGGGLLTFAVLGFVIGAVLVGTAASPLIANLLMSGGQGADVHIVPNAMNAPTPYAPGTLTVSVNATVRWYNGDTNQHTVTSDTGVFASPLLDPGGWFSFKFTQKGTFPYHCEPHPNMTGTVVVT